MELVSEPLVLLVSAQPTALLKNKSQLVALVADYQQQVEHQAESKRHPTLVAVAVAVVEQVGLVVAPVEPPSDLSEVVLFQLEGAVAWIVG